MEVKMFFLPLESVPGMRKKAREHDEWAKEAVEKFAESGEEAALLEVPEFDVSYQTVKSLLTQYGVRHGVKPTSVDLSKNRATDELRAIYGDTGYLTYLVRDAR